MEGASTAAAIRTAISAPAITGATASLQLPAGTTAQRDGSPAAGMFRFNSETGEFEGYDGSVWGSVGGAGNVSSQTFSGTGAQTAFTLSSAPASLPALEVFISGVRQTPTADYTFSG
ncbi:hypothetical protein RZS08_34780, partial [Arthrospira platensis SPKY1]|nr:hypothetical protein [Arthrospira platensis SPKY1]